MLIPIIIIYSLIIFPVFLNINIYYSKIKNKVYFKIKLFNFIKILKGYVERIEEGFVFHISSKKAIILPYKNILGMRKKIKPLKDYNIIKFNLTINYGNNKNLFNALVISSFFQILNNNILKILCVNKKHVKINNQINIYEDKNLFNIKCRASVIFNILMVLISIIKIIMEKFFYALKSITNRKQQNKSIN